MCVLWVTLLLLHQGYTLVPVTTGQLGETVSLTCTMPHEGQSSTALHWYKQGAGDTLKLIVKQVKNKILEFGPGHFASRLNVTHDGKFSHLTIFKTVQDDEGMYHCAKIDWSEDTWNGMYLSLKGNSERTSNYTVVQTASDPARPGDSVTLQCSVFSDSEDKTCPRNLSAFWFKTGSDKSLPQIIYTDGNIHNKCDNRSHPQKKCVYDFYKNISSSDDGIYYCAVATCGEILFGDGTKLVTVSGSSLWSQDVRAVIFLLSFVLALSLIVIAVLIYATNKNTCEHCEAAAVLQKCSGGQKSQQTDEDRLVYSAVVFAMMKTDTRAIKEAAEKQRSYANIKAFGLN
ncbi:uncharacterized protein LOC121643505 [Melanotaenia boesemani]|uniref:uncharacterized protein LOC121643505 n=1 Tax=Melanotaenia boesemani TaxID=1250792 RepID=UPI001C04A917|nr:uncharacterized protein LOC121643505 [Melanotaenia boesemani]